MRSAHFIATPTLDHADRGLMAPPNTDGELVLLQERSAGTFSTVYVAESRTDGGLARIVAVKHLKAHWTGSDEVIDRTRDEARLLSRLQHKNILRVEQLVELAGRPAVVMEFVDGVDVKQLAQHLTEQKQPFPPRAAYRIALGAASALDAAWSQVPFGTDAPLQVVHRDIKPSNLMVSRQGEVKVLDFGTARFNHEARVAQTQMLRFGSLRYMSPERKEGGRGDHSGDVYSLGLVLINLLRGRRSKVLPVDREAHDAKVAAAIAGIPDTGLPDDRWDQTLFETLARMCAYESHERLSADQCVPLLRAFAEQATGASLESLATRVVGPLADQTFGKLGDGPRPNLDARPGVRDLSTIDTPPPEELEPPPDPSVISSGPKTLPPPPLSEPPPPTEPLARPASPPPVQTPPPDPFEQPTTQIERPARAPEPAPAPMPAPARTAPKPRPRPAPPAPKPGLSTPLLVGLGLLAFIVVIGGGGAAAWAMGLFSPSARPQSAIEPAAFGTTDATTGNEDTVQHAISVDSSESIVRWIRVRTSDGTELLKGSPSGTTMVPDGLYRLEVKVAGRPTVSTEFEALGDIQWSCSPAEANTVVCEAPGRRLLLSP